MKLRKIQIENVRSFLDSAELVLDGEISIVIGPNGGGKTNLLDIATTTLRRHLLTSWVSVKSPTLDIPDRYALQTNEGVTSIVLEKHSRGGNRSQRVELELEVRGCPEFCVS